MLRGSVVIFTGVLSVVWLKRKLRAYNWIGMVLVLAGLVLVGLSSVLDSSATSSSAKNPLLGDVIICPSVAADNCSTNKGSYPGHEGSLTDEIDLLVVHGILHVLGMDHADDSERHQMQERERDHLTGFVGRNL